jgi:epoxyqueuosine reductase
MLRNVCVALGNWADPSAVAALTQALLDVEPVVRGHAAWALGEIARRHQHAESVDALRNAQSTEPDALVREEIAAALA